MCKLYYFPPEDWQFDELKREAIALWSTMGSEPTYSQEKIGRIKDIKNVEDNFMYILAMFDVFNQKKVIKKLSKETKQAIMERLIDGGSDIYIIREIGLI